MEVPDDPGANPLYLFPLDDPAREFEVGAYLNVPEAIATGRATAVSEAAFDDLWRRGGGADDELEAAPSELGRSAGRGEEDEA